MIEHNGRTNLVRRGFRRITALRLFWRLVPTLLDFLVDVVRDLGPHRLVHDELVERCDLGAALGTDEVALEQVSLNAFLAVQRTAARRLHGITEELVVYGTYKRRVRWCPLSDVCLRQARLMFRDLFLP